MWSTYETKGSFCSLVDSIWLTTGNDWRGKHQTCRTHLPPSTYACATAANVAGHNGLNTFTRLQSHFWAQASSRRFFFQKYSEVVWVFLGVHWSFTGNFLWVCCVESSSLSKKAIISCRKKGQVWIDFLSVNITKKETFKPETSLINTEKKISWNQGDTKWTYFKSPCVRSYKYIQRFKIQIKKGFEPHWAGGAVATVLCVHCRGSDDDDDDYYYH